jgi:hypothetical protein
MKPPPGKRAEIPKETEEWENAKVDPGVDQDDDKDPEESNDEGTGDNP